MKTSMITALAFAGVAVAGVSTAHAQMRFQGMDRNHDGVITRSEWRGSTKSFREHDWNGDGVLSGDEVRPGAQRPAANDYEHNGVRDWNQDGIVNERDATIQRRFNTFDRNGDGRISEGEWRATNPNMNRFAQLDTNHDRTLTVAEFATGDRQNFQGGPQNDFTMFDRNRDGNITPNEWRFSRDEFNRLDSNRDGRISEWEFRNYNGLNGSPSYANPAPNNVRTRATQAGYDRGLTEGRQAGREDKANGHGWDLDGQTELERADSGYYSQIGPLTEYQGGYREGFRIGYREGFGAR